MYLGTMNLYDLMQVNIQYFLILNMLNINLNYLYAP